MPDPTIAELQHQEAEVSTQTFVDLTREMFAEFAPLGHPFDRMEAFRKFLNAYDAWEHFEECVAADQQTLNASTTIEHAQFESPLPLQDDEPHTP